MKIFDHNHRQLDRNRDCHSRSNYERMFSFNHIHERHWHWQSDWDIRDNNYFFDVRHVLHSDEQKTSVFEIDHWDHDLFERNNEIRSRFEHDWESFQKSSHNHFLELSNRNSRHSELQETVRSIFIANSDSKNKTLRSRNSHSLNSRSRWNLKQRSNRHSRQKNHRMKTIKSRIIDFRHCQFEDIHFNDQKWNSHSRKNWVNWDLKNHHHEKNH
jgi:hypothetical protein